MCLSLYSRQTKAKRRLAEPWWMVTFSKIGRLGGQSWMGASTGMRTRQGCGRPLSSCVPVPTCVQFLEKSTQHMASTQEVISKSNNKLQLATQDYVFPDVKWILITLSGNDCFYPQLSIYF